MSKTQVHQFLNKENIQVLWDVLIEDPTVKNFCSSHEKIIELTKIFESNVKGFYDMERKNCDNLIEMNKKYMLLIINYLNSQILLVNSKNMARVQQPIQLSHYQSQNTQQQQEFRKITIHDEQIKQPITYEEIQNERKTQFEKDLYNRQREFTNAMTNPVPPVPDFSDKIDEPISEIELEIKRIQEQRNYDMDLINKNYQKNITEQNKNIINNDIVSNDNTNSWLKGENTSIKNEKHISWAADTTENNDNSFLTKLKKTNQIDSIDTYISGNTNINKNMSLNIDTNIYEEINYLKDEVNSLNIKLNIIMEKIEKIIIQ